MPHRRANNMGSITRRKDGRWMDHYTVHTAKGPKPKAIYGKTRVEAAEKLTKAMAERWRAHHLRRWEPDRRVILEQVALR